jgi:two-component system cell cycle sensor histidine kinase/response regulator CckA
VTRPLRVLHLEDRPRDAAIVRDRLDEGLSCNILVANGKDSYEAALAEESFDLVICDYNLPGYDGVAALKRAQATQPDVPVILISGTVVEEQAVRCLQIGATDYLLKDRLERLVPAVQRALQEAETRRTRKSAEAALGESEARKAAILDSVLDCIVTMDAKGTVIEFNTAAARTFGYSQKEAIGRPLADLIIPPRFHERHRAGLAHYLATGEGPVLGKLIEITAMRSDGTELPVELAITAIRLGSASIFTGVLRDITARRQAEATRARLAAIVDSSDDAIFSMAVDETILSWNAGAERLYGYTASEMIGRNRALLAPAGKSAELVSVMERATHGETGGPFETQHLRKDGSVIDISLVTSPMTDSTGRITSVSTIARDITSRKRVEAALRDERDRAQRYLDTAEVTLLALDVDGKITLINRKGCDLLGWSADELAGCSWVDMCLPLLFRNEMRQKFDAVVQGRVSIINFENPVLTRSGAERLIEWRNTVLRNETGQVVGTFSSGTDITERRTLEEQYQQAQKMEAVGRLAGGVAHDFNNLLTVILGFCELLLADLDPADARQRDIAEIQKAGTRAAALTRQLLIFSRKEIIQPTLLDLNVIVADMRMLLGRLIGEDVEVVLALGRAVASVKADRGQVEQIILNLAVNARDAMPNGGTLTIETANIGAEACRAKGHFAVAPGPCVALTVTDTGTGMTPEVRARLFEPFFTTKGVGKGTGLGLAMVHGIVARNAGSVSVESEVGKGASFTVYFPQANAAQQVVAAPPPAEQPPAGRHTVLVVEDATGLRALTKRLLERLGHSVWVAANADEARQLFDRNPSIDLLLTDVVMPGASGPELVAQLKKQRPTLNVIYMSGYTDDAIAHHGVLAPEIAFLQKPFTSATLDRKLREVLD